MPNARRTDPETSWWAAKSVANLRPTQLMILRLLSYQAGTDEQIAEGYQLLVDNDLVPPVSPSGLRSRRAELVDLGYVFDSGLRATLTTGRKAIVWQITPEGIERVIR